MNPQENRPQDPPPALPDSAAAELRSFGYAQELRRSMGKFSSFAMAFSLISVTTGIFANFGHGIRQVGPSIVGSWSAVVLGQLLVALVLADLSTRYPLSGYGYQWTARLVNPHFGFFVGWLLLLQFLAGFPGVCSALAVAACGFATSEPVPAWMVAAITVAVISATALIHLSGIRWVSLINNAGVTAEIAGVVSLTAVLLVLAALCGDRGLSFLLDTTSHRTGGPAGLPAFALSLLMGAWCLTGFEAAADLAEETHRPKDVIPGAIIASELGAGISGLLMLVGLTLAIDDLGAVQGSEAPLIRILETKLGAAWTPPFLVLVFVSIFACGVASMAAATRLIFSLARDGMLPLSRTLRKVHPAHRTPRNAIVLVWIVSSAMVIFMGQLDAITSISAVAGYLGYAGIALAALVAPAATGARAAFSLGRLRRLVGVLALLWTLTLVGALTIPETEVRGFEEKHLPAKSTALAIGLGIAVYAAIIRRRIQTGIAGPPKPSPAEPKEVSG